MIEIRKKLSANGQRQERNMSKTGLDDRFVANFLCYRGCNICVRNKNQTHKSDSSAIVLGQIPPVLKIRSELLERYINS